MSDTTPYSVSPGLEHLCDLLRDIERFDQDYHIRYSLVLQALSEASKRGLAAGFRIDPEEPDWPVAYIELPAGQVSWHMPQHPVPWDGHTTEQKYERCRRLLDAPTGGDRR